jgi:hypothetical protein
MRSVNKDAFTLVSVIKKEKDIIDLITSSVAHLEHNEQYRVR